MLLELVENVKYLMILEKKKSITQVSLIFLNWFKIRLIRNIIVFGYHPKLIKSLTPILQAYV